MPDNGGHEGQREADHEEEEMEACHGGILRKVKELKEVKEVKAVKEVRQTAFARIFEVGISLQAFLRITPSITLATSSHLSTAVSMTSKISFHLMICTESVSSSKSWAMSVRQRRSLSFS